LAARRRRGPSRRALSSPTGFGASLVVGQRVPIAALALKHRLPGMFPFKENVVAGGLMSYGADPKDLYRRAAAYVDKILKGAPAG
jgi:putative ABC transport system substrate-binding protein